MLPQLDLLSMPHINLQFCLLLSFPPSCSCSSVFHLSVFVHLKLQLMMNETNLPWAEARAALWDGVQQGLNWARILQGWVLAQWPPESHQGGAHHGCNHFQLCIHFFPQHSVFIIYSKNRVPLWLIITQLQMIWNVEIWFPDQLLLLSDRWLRLSGQIEDKVGRKTGQKLTWGPHSVTQLNIEIIY